jgi:hypothetical protein
MGTREWANMFARHRREGKSIKSRKKNKKKQLHTARNIDKLERNRVEIESLQKGTGESTTSVPVSDATGMAKMDVEKTKGGAFRSDEIPVQSSEQIKCGNILGTSKASLLKSQPCENMTEQCSCQQSVALFESLCQAFLVQVQNSSCHTRNMLSHPIQQSVKTVLLPCTGIPEEPLQNAARGKEEPCSSLTPNSSMPQLGEPESVQHPSVAATPTESYAESASSVCTRNGSELGGLAGVWLSSESSGPLSQDRNISLVNAVEDMASLSSQPHAPTLASETTMPDQDCSSCNSTRRRRDTWESAIGQSLKDNQRRHARKQRTISSVSDAVMFDQRKYILGVVGEIFHAANGFGVKEWTRLEPKHVWHAQDKVGRWISFVRVVSNMLYCCVCFNLF